MPSLKDLKNRIESVKSTRKITSAMKMVAAAKLRRAQEQAEAGRPYAERMDNVLSSLAEKARNENGLPLLNGTGRNDIHLLVVVTSDRGLCGGFNSSIIKKVKTEIKSLINDNKQVKILCVGKKGRDLLKSEFGPHIIKTIDGIGKPRLTFNDAAQISEYIQGLLAEESFDVCRIFYNKFQSALVQIVTPQTLIPLSNEESDEKSEEAEKASADDVLYEYEPEEGELLARLLPRNFSIQIYKALLESNASEHGARMTAMDNATRSAGDIIKNLTITYNRTRQAVITKELIEIISGAEAV